MLLWKKPKKVKRKYLMVSKSERWSIKEMAKDRKVTMAELTAHLIRLGLHHADDASKRNIVIDSFARPHHTDFILSKNKRAYISVACKTHEIVKNWAKTNDLKLVEATWRLLFIGFIYHTQPDPRQDPRYPVVKELCEAINKAIEEKVPYPEIAKKFFVDSDVAALNDVDPFKTRGARSNRSPQKYPIKRVIRRLIRENEILKSFLIGATKAIQDLQQEILRLNTATKDGS